MKILASFVAAALLLSTLCHAGLLRLESTTLSSFRKDENQENELPFYEFLEAAYGSANRDLEFNANFSYANDALAEVTDEFNLYALDLSYALIPGVLKVKAGRSFNIQQTIRTTLTDGGGLEFSLFQNRVKLGALAGYERTREIDTFEKRAQLASTYLTYRSSSPAPVVITTKYQYRNFDDPEQEPQHLAHAGFRAPVGSVEMLGNAEYNLSDYHNRLAEIGADIYATDRLMFRLLETTYYVKPDEDIVEPIYATFARGRLYETTAQVDYKFTRDLSAAIAGAYVNYDLGGHTRTDGYKTTLSMRLNHGRATSNVAGYFFDSYGGQAYGGLLKVAVRANHRVGFTAGGEITHYDKVTSSERNAYSSQASMDISFRNPFRLSVGGEFNSNNYLRYDARAVAKLTYLLWAEI